MDDVSKSAAERYFEDYHVGMVDEFGDIAVTAEEIVEFARRYDPQAMHVDPWPRRGVRSAD